MLDTGKEINFIINTKCDLIHNWSAFANYISIKKIFPESNVVLLSSYCVKFPLLTWAKKLNIFVKYVNEEDKFLKVNHLKIKGPSVLLDSNIYLLDHFDCDFLRKNEKYFYGDENVWFFNSFEKFEYKKLSSNANSDDNSLFVNIMPNVGNFIYDKWINSSGSPFRKIDQIKKDKVLNEKELKIINLWRDCNNLYSTLH